MKSIQTHHSLSRHQWKPPETRMITELLIRSLMGMQIVVVQLLSTVRLFCGWMVHSSPGPSVQGISQTRILEWVVISFFRGSSQPGDQTQVSCIAGRFFTIWATRKALHQFCLNINKRRKEKEKDEQSRRSQGKSLWKSNQIWRKIAMIQKILEKREIWVVTVSDAVEVR